MVAQRVLSFFWIHNSTGRAVLLTIADAVRCPNAQDDVSLALINVLGESKGLETNRGDGSGGTITLADFCSMKAIAERPGSITLQ